MIVNAMEMMMLHTQPVVRMRTIRPTDARAATTQSCPARQAAGRARTVARPATRRRQMQDLLRATSAPSFGSDP
jgi:hypothetical protein